MSVHISFRNETHKKRKRLNPETQDRLPTLSEAHALINGPKLTNKQTSRQKRNFKPIREFHKIICLFAKNQNGIDVLKKCCQSLTLEMSTQTFDDFYSYPVIFRHCKTITDIEKFIPLFRQFVIVYHSVYNYAAKWFRNKWLSPLIKWVLCCYDMLLLLLKNMIFCCLRISSL